ncbi:DNA helicase UvrD, partial [Candidatus Daviesbacteria bacterium]|nr:DNA helicase UvrD [Candidatus Daviesbacteria bacterium]
MAYVADLHIHSRFSRACSQALNVPNLVAWAKLKGIDILGTGDFLHPLWFAELKSQLKDDGSGFLIYEKDPSVKFVLTVEVASIYSHKGAVRRVHNLIFLPTFSSAAMLQQALLAKRANISSDGRPIVGIPSKELLRMCLEIDQNALFIPAHAWTPWFGIFGSQSGYDSLEDAFEDLTQYIYAVETGLSSDPAMNWRIAELDNRSIISCSDAHSLPNLGRESTVFAGNMESGYLGIFRDIKEQKIAGTIEFYPEEGKYHYTGHRNCNIKYCPEDTKAKGTRCPVCGKGLTVGVMERVEELASRSVGELGEFRENGVIKTKNFDKPGYRMLVPLLQIIAEAFDT